MKKIKLFSLVAAALFAGSTMAQTTTLFDAADTGWTATGVDLTTGPTTVGEVTWNGRGSAAIATSSKTFDDNVKWNARLKFGGKSTFSTKTMSGVLSFNVEKAGTVKVYCQGGGGGDRTTYISQTITSTTNDATTAIGSFTSKEQAIGIATAQVEAGTVYVWADNNVGVYGITFEASAPVTEPWIAFSKEELSLKVTPFVTTAEAELTLKGGNLAAGTYDLSLPTVTGLTITPTSVTVAKDGTLNDTITLSYTSDVNVEAASDELALNIGELTASVTIDYAARVDAYTQTTVIDSTTWDWSKAGIEDVQLDSTKTTPTRLDTFVLANVEGIVNDASFNSQALLVRGQYMFYKKYNCFQGDYISFIAENKGTVQVTFSNTSKRNANQGLGRVLYINGVATNDSTLTTDKIDSKPVEVPAGQVTITSQMPSQPGINQFLRVYSITFVPKETGTALEQNSLFVPATKVIRNGQLLIIREGKTYTVQGVEVK